MQHMLKNHFKSSTHLSILYAQLIVSPFINPHKDLRVTLSFPHLISEVDT